MSMEPSRFESMADAVLAALADRVEAALDSVEVDLINGILTIETEDGRSFVINKHGPNQQIWLSSPISGASHYDHKDGRWIATRGEGDLMARLSTDLSAASGQTMVLD